MADSTIPNLPSFSGTPNGTEPMETVQSGASVQIPSQKIADLATVVLPLTKTAMDGLVTASQVSTYKLYLITNAVSNTRRLLVKGKTTTTLEDTAIDMSTGQIGTYVLSTDTFTAAGSGNANITPITAAALATLESTTSLSLTTIYIVTDAPLRMAIQAETISQLGQTGTIVDDVYSGVVDYDLATNTFLNGTIYDGDGNIWNGCLPSDNINLGAGSEGNTFHQRVRNITLGTNSNGNIFEYLSGSGAAITCGTDAINNIFKQGAEGFTFGNNLQNTTIEANVLGANYTASPAYDFLYNNAYDSVIFQSGGVNYHRYFDVANDRIVVTLMASPYTVSYIGGGLTNPMTTGGDIIYGGGSGVPTRLANGTAGQVLQSNGTTLAPSWVAASGGGDAYLANDQTFTGENTFNIPSGNDTPITITKGGNGAGLKVTKSSGSGDAIEVAEGSVSIDDETASTIASFDANKRIKSLATSTYPSLTELAHVKGVGSQVVGTTDTNILTNKRITARTGTVASDATPTINTDNVDFFSITAQTVDITSFTTNLSGTPTDAQTLWIAITGTAARAITWGASFEASTIALPTTTVTTARLDVAFIYNTVTSKWRCVGVA